LIGALAAGPILWAGAAVVVAAEPKVIATQPQKFGNGWSRWTGMEVRSRWV
jgi:hypothetical protein